MRVMLTKYIFDSSAQRAKNREHATKEILCEIQDVHICSRIITKSIFTHLCYYRRITGGVTRVCTQEEFFDLMYYHKASMGYR